MADKIQALANFVEQPRYQATAAIARYVSHSVSIAAGIAAALNADELAAVLDAAKKVDPREQIQTIIDQANDRRRDAAALEAQRELADRRRSVLAQRAVERLGDCSSEEAAALVSGLELEPLAYLSALANEPGAEPEIEEIVARARTAPPVTD